ncbi:hypothetical protein [Actinotalea sp.]|uniref:hypothetical protein n=1 Tax=Actinotalea sp. TaxID=1872145 RepID=UPI003568FF40
MDATDRRFERRRFLTRHDVEDAHAAGRPIRLSGRDSLTHEAAQRARELSVPVERSDGPALPTPASAPQVLSASRDDLRAAVRAAVVAELGSEPPNLDAVIDKVLRSRT